MISVISCYGLYISKYCELYNTFFYRPRHSGGLSVMGDFLGGVHSQIGSQLNEGCHASN